jgi:lipoate synthase
MSGCMLGIGEEQVAGSHVRQKGCRYRCSQLFIGELLKQVQRFLACCRELRTKRFHTVIAVGIDVGLIALV